MQNTFQEVVVIIVPYIIYLLILPTKLALDRLGFNDYRTDAEAVLKDCKAVAAKRRRQSTRLENLGIPEEELLRQ